MGTARVWQRVEIEIDGNTFGIGSREVPQTITIGDDESFVKTFNVAASGTTEIFDVDNDMSEFDILAVRCDRNLILELVTDDDGDVGEEDFTVGLLGTGTDDDFGPLFILTRDDSYANYTVAFAGGTLDVIERLTVKNLDSSNAAKVQILAAT